MTGPPPSVPLLPPFDQNLPIIQSQRRETTKERELLPTYHASDRSGEWIYTPTGAVAGPSPSDKEDGRVRDVSSSVIRPQLYRRKGRINNIKNIEASGVSVEMQSNSDGTSEGGDDDDDNDGHWMRISWLSNAVAIEDDEDEDQDSPSSFWTLPP